MDDILLNFIINILLMAFAIFPIREEIFDKSLEGNLLKKISKKGWSLIFFAVLIVGFNFYKDLEADSKQLASEKAKQKIDSLFQDSQEKILQLQIATKDSIIGEVNKTYINSIKASNEALAKYNLKYTDSLHSVVSRLKLNAINPQLSLAPLEKDKQFAYTSIIKGKDMFNIKLVSNGGTSYNILLNLYILKEVKSNALTILESYNISYGQTFLVENVTSTRTFPLLQNIQYYSDAVIFITGSFSKDPGNNYVIPFNFAFRFDFKENKYITGLDLDFAKLKSDLNIK